MPRTPLPCMMTSYTEMCASRVETLQLNAVAVCQKQDVVADLAPHGDALALPVDKGHVDAVGRVCE